MAALENAVRANIGGRGPIVDLLAWQQEVGRRVADIRHANKGKGIARSASLSFDAKATTAYTDGSSIVCPLPPMNATQQDYEVLRGQVIHEVGHLYRPRVFEVLREKGLGHPSPLKILFNQIEDRVQESQTAERHLGDRLSLDRFHAIVTRRQIKMLDKGMATPEMDEKSKDATAKINAALTVGIMGSSWMPEAVKALDNSRTELARILGDTYETTVNDLLSEGWGKRINNTALSPDEAFELAKELRVRLFPDEDPEQDCQPQASAAGKGAAGKGDNSEGEGSIPMYGRIPWHLLTHSDHDEKKEKIPCPSSIDWDGIKRTTRVPHLFKDQEVVTRFSTPGSYATELQRKQDRGLFPTSLVAEVRRKLQAKTKCRWRGEQLEGRLDIRNLRRLVMPMVGDGTYNRSVFRQKKRGLELDVAISILVDSSGSMSGDKYVSACISAIALNELCQQSLRVPSEIIGFTTGDYKSSPCFYVHKTFAQRAVSTDQLINTLGSSTISLSGNADAESVMFAVQRLRKQTTARKVLIVLSDGAPADAVGGCGEAFNNLKNVIELVRKAQDVELYGIGIQDQNVRKFYSKNAPVVNHTKDVAPALLHVLDDVLQKKPDGGVVL